MLGEIQYSQLVRANISGSFQFGTLLLILVIIMAILLSIVMVNLLIGLAVGDIEKIRMNATIESVSLTIQMFTQIDTTLPKRIIARYDRHCYRKYPNMYRNKLDKFIHIVSKNIRSVMESESESNSELNNKVLNYEGEISALRQDINHLINMVTELTDQGALQNRFHQDFDGYEPHNNHNPSPAADLTSHLM